jgi:hypothetical protein
VLLNSLFCLIVHPYTLHRHLKNHGENSKNQEARYVTTTPCIATTTHNPLEVTVHSRAARRAASPSIDLDKTLRKTTRDSTSPSRPSNAKPHALAAQNAGIQKKQKKGTMTRAQRLRHQKGLERAGEILDKRQVKVVKSIGKQENIKNRAQGWEDVNGDGKKKKKKTKTVDEAEAAEEADKISGWVDDEDMDDTAAAVQEPAAGEAAKVQEDPAVAAGISLPVVEDELL